ncbi:MAG: tetratricopeptide repeat protein [Actinobacteria bacterium]|nr:MAG: tetratricopeptide repeat protein [Actinomycetota bacterium]
MKPVFSLLGPLTATVDGTSIELGGQKRRALLAALLLRADQVVTRDHLVDALWGEDPPDTARNTLQVYVSQVRKLLPEGLLETTPDGYRLAIDPGAVDVFEFERLTQSGRSALTIGDAAGAAETLRRALDLWRGTPTDLPQLEALRLEELRLTAQEDRIDAELALGRHVQLVGELERLVAEQPLRERARAQLMLALYRSGRQADALAVYQRARRTLVEELGIEPGESLRKLERAILEQDPALNIHPAATARRIPTPPTPLLGRERELDALADVVRGSGTRLLTLTGIGGIGKTRLALELVRRLAPEFQHGACVATLANVRDPAHVTRAILEALEVPETSGSPDEQLESCLRNSELLLLVDNFEQVLPAAASIARLLDAAPRLKIVVTSRAPLRVAAEREFAVPPLVDEEAAELFISRAQAANANFDLSEQNAAAVAELCMRLEGLPLAIELAAARTKLLSPSTLLARLTNRLALLTGGRRDAPQHQQTLRMTFDWSYDLLEPSPQQLFARLSVFSGGWTLAAAEEICDATLEDLGTLVDESLVRRRDERFSMLEIVREYARERLGRDDDLRGRHLEYFVALAEEAEPELRGRDQPAWFARIEDELDNLREALSFALETRDASSALRLVVGIRRFWQIHGHLAEGRDALDAALALTPDEPSELRSQALNMAGILAGEQGDFDAARASFNAALDDARAVDAERAISSALVNLGNLAFFSGDLPAARALYTESIEHFRSLGDLRGEALANENVGLMALTADDLPEAVTWLTAAVELARAGGDDREIGAASRSLAAALLEVEKSNEAENLLEESLEVARRLGDAHGIAVSLETFAGLAATSGDAERAATLFGASDAVRSAIGAQRQPDNQILYERWLARTLARLDTKGYSRRYEDGRTLTTDEACALALGAAVRMSPSG